MRKSPCRTGAASFFSIVALLLLTLAWRAPRFDTTPAAHQWRQPATVQFSGAAAQAFLRQPGEAQSLMAALNGARFGLKQQEHAPFDEKSGPGYLAMSHDQNLNAWFAEDGIRVRSTVRERENAEAWQLAFRLKEYGYGAQLMPAPPIVSQQVKGTRIEYDRSFNRKSKTENPTLIEWYENKSAGIEQGFTINQAPPRQSNISSQEPLRVVVSVGEDLSARVADGGQQIELVDREGKALLSYSKLVAVDADGKRLTSRMEARDGGREIALLVDDAGARYPIIVDPVVASLEKKLDDYVPEDRFGVAVAIDGDKAVVGAWRWASDTGKVYVFSRSGSGSTWSNVVYFEGASSGDQCGRSVAISGSKVTFGCPGGNTGAGSAFVSNIPDGPIELVPAPGTRNAGDQYGASVAISGDNIVVGAPFNDNRNFIDNGAAFFFVVDSNLNYTVQKIIDNRGGSLDGAHLGTSVAMDGSTIIAGAPGLSSGLGDAVVFTGDYTFVSALLFASDGVAGDNFGNSVAISGNTAVIGAWGNDQKATDAGAAYVFVRDPNGTWNQQQKLTASDGKANDYFSNSAVAIQGNTIVVGAYAFEPFNLAGATDYGKAYVFMRNGTVWTEQTTMVGDDNGGDNFGISVGISGTGVIAGARTASASDGTSRAGAAYVYRLDCTPPYHSSTVAEDKDLNPKYAYCPGELVSFFSYFNGGTGSAATYQWRKDGVNIPGATNSGYGIGNLTAADAASYDVVISNSCGSDISGASAITIHTFSLNPKSQNFGVSGSTGIVNVSSTGNTCNWTATSNASFITINAGASGTGNATVGFTVAANPNSGQRTGTITIADQTFTVTQDGTNCSYTIAPKSQTLDANASTKMVSVTASAGCKWAAKSNDSFISINAGASGTGNGTVTYTVAANFTAMQRTGTLTVAGQTVTITQHGAVTPTPTPSPTATATATPTATPKPTSTPPSLGNISTRLRVDTGDNVLIGGFIVTGTEPKKVIVRAIGPSLPVSGALQNPVLELHSKSAITTNDNWVDAPNEQAIIDTTVAPKSDLESAILTTLPANSSAYTAVVRGVNNGTGVGLVEVFDLDASADSRLANISTRGLVQRGDNAMIGGFIVLNGNQKVIVRAIGPSLPVSGALQDPFLELHDNNGVVLQRNDNWKTGGQQAEIIATTVAPTRDEESAIVRTLAPGNYTAVVRGVKNTTGVALVEVYALQ